jgi:hypothetical protein
LPLLNIKGFVHSHNCLGCSWHRGGHFDSDPSLKTLSARRKFRLSE